MSVPDRVEHVARVLHRHGQTPARRGAVAACPFSLRAKRRATGGSSSRCAPTRPAGELLRRCVDLDGAVLHVEDPGGEVQAALDTVLG